MNVEITEHIESFIKTLDPKVQSEVYRKIDLLIKFGSLLRMPSSRAISDGLFELRIRSKVQVRIFFCFFQGSACLLHGFVKKTQKTPAQDLKMALKLKNRLTSI